METISPLIPPQRIGSATSGGGNKSQGGYQAQQGQTVQAKVNQILANSLFELEIGGQKILARSDAKLTTGQTLQLQVLQTTPEIELKILSPSPNQLTGKSLTLLHNNFDITNLFEQVSRNTKLPLENLSQSSRETINQFIQLQNDSLGLKEDTKQITAFIEKFTTILQNGEKNPQQLMGQLKSAYSELADIISKMAVTPRLENIAQLPSAEIKSPLSSTIFELLQYKTANKDISPIVEQINTALGIVSATQLTSQPATVATQLQNSIFSLLQQFTSLPAHWTSSSSTGNFLSDSSVLSQKDGGQVLKQLVDHLGLKFEALLAQGKTEEAAKTLKAALFDIAQQFGNSKNIAEATNRILSTLELFQQVQLHFDSERQIIVPLPLPFLEQGFLVVDKDSREKDTDQDEIKNNNFSLYLSLKELGNMRIDFNTVERGVNLHFYCENKERADFIAEHKEQLEKVITSVKLLRVIFTDKATDPASELLRKMVPEGQSILNTTI